MSATFGWNRFGESAVRLLLTIVFLGAAVMKLAAFEFEVANFERFG